MKLEEWEGIASRKLLVDKDRALILKETDLTDKDGLKERLEQESLPLNQARKKLVRREVSKNVKFSGFELKQHFLKKGELENSKKTDELESENPKTNLAKVKNETEFFGLSFLEGFLEFYGVKLDLAVKRYEDELHIIEERDLITNRQSASIVKSSDGMIDKVVTVKDKKRAEEELKKFYARKRKKETKQQIIQSRKEENNENND